MSRVKNYCLAIAAVLVALIATVPQSVAATCSNASIKGQYGIFINGYDSSGPYQHGVGVINSNGAGRFTGVETVSDDGTSSNCRGTMSYSFNGTTVHLNIYFVNGDKGFFAIETDSGTVASSVFQQ